MPANENGVHAADFRGRDFPLSPIVQGMVVSGLPAGSMAGASLAGRLGNFWGGAG
ncbi:hypothetical protein AB0F91_30950 [Amycolatopsis sp. NPDC023774]|uniref:hypothetical protein n=1 Tax=Amycolatopsis sp. NPDC023774 TaxID=3155015 RepID=UPI0033F43E35